MILMLLPREKVGAGIALSHVSFQAAMLSGPAPAGLTAGLWGAADATQRKRWPSHRRFRVFPACLEPRPRNQFQHESLIIAI